MQRLNYLDLQTIPLKEFDLLSIIKSLQADVAELKQSSNIMKEVEAFETINSENFKESDITQDTKIHLEKEVFDLKKEFAGDFDFIKKTFDDIYEKITILEVKGIPSNNSVSVEKINEEIKEINSNLFIITELIRDDRKNVGEIEKMLQKNINELKISISEGEEKVKKLEEAPPFFNKHIKEKLENLASFDFKDVETRVKNMVALETRFIEQLNAMKTRLSATIFKHGGDIKILDERLKKIEN